MRREEETVPEWVAESRADTPSCKHPEQLSCCTAAAEGPSQRVCSPQGADLLRKN